MKKTLKNIESHSLYTIGLVTVCIIVSIFIWSWSNSFEISSVSADTPHPCWTVDVCGSNIECMWAITDPNLCGLGGVGI